ncbi:4-hydroxy-tetrahydrodipicolinate synthase [Vitreoscilla sp. C1]|uniref:4-hydroxy-tetrahydrodipicolinate synthase n=1 Tax=Vitreoscilla sp. (strain C1) TaxID=96942 RepID=UPI000CDBD389|nr:4-hydroxy-tetrahydrodipicolinate synthase [Vitreoscilla sp. C1]AUZ04680.1 4-hydroxy-tetrahydrodipicolinate synthase [Vitreoscilla sp. C1]
MIKGSIVAIVTPMHADGAVDFERFKTLIDWHIDNGTQAIVPVGTTGETATLSMEEHLAVVECAVKHANKRIPIIAGAGANNTAEAIHLSKECERLGADYTLSVVPYYNKPSQEGIYQHFKAIAQAAAIPMIIYNVPGRTVVDMSNDTILRLAEIDNIVGVKEASGDIGRACDLIKRAPEGFALYSGDDSSALAFLLCGGDGIISVCANVAPREFSDMCQAALEGDVIKARQLNNPLQSLHVDMFCEASPAPAKWAMAQLNIIESHVRLPILPMTTVGEEKVRAAMQEAGLI